MNSKTIRVQGKGIATQSPDRVGLTFTITGEDVDFSRAIEKCNRRIEALHEAAQSCSIPATELKTINFDVSDETEYNSGRRYHVGFKSTHKVRVALPIDNELLGRFLSAVMRGKVTPQISFTFEVSDAEGLKQRVLADAVENAKRRAQTIADASGVALGSILNIEYGYSEVFVYSEAGSMDAEGSIIGSDIPEFRPDDIEVSDTVTIVWEIGSLT